MEGGHLSPSHTTMPKSANSIDCACGGNYVKKNKSRHIKTKLHRAFMERHCGNHGCGKALEDWEDYDYVSSKDGEEQKWCLECLQMNGLEARRNGHVFNELAEEKLYYEEHKEVCHHCGELATMEDNRCGLCGKPQWQCGNPGCGTELDEEEMIVYSLSRNGVETKWCEECFDNDGLEARRNGWVFDGDGEDILNERIEQGVYHCSHCDKTSHDEQECSECGFSGYAPELGCRDETCDVCKKGKESEFFCDVHSDLHVKHDGDGGYYCDECDA